jgi:hypothetical protein
MKTRLFLSVFMLLATVSSANAASVMIPLIFPVPPATPSASTADYQKIHTVAVISALGAHMTLRNYHFVGPKDHELDIADWQIDDDIVARIKQYLGGRFEFKSVAYDRAALAAIPNGKWDGLDSKFPAFLRSLPSDSVDAYIVVRPDLGTQAPGVEGLGLENGGAFGDMTPVVWANYEIDIVDARTAKVIASAYSQLRLRDKTPASFAGIVVASRNLRVGDDFKLNDVQLKSLRLNVSYLVHLSLRETLRALNMGVDLPPPGSRVISPFPPGQDPYRNYKSVAVVSGVADVLDLEHLGGTILSRDTYAVPKPEWQLDSMLEKRAEDALRGRFEIKSANVDRAAFAKARLLDGDGKYNPAFPGLSPDPATDLYVVFVKVRNGLPPTNATGMGVGVFNKSVVLTMTEAFAYYAVAVLDAHTMKVLLTRVAEPSPAHPEDTPVEKLDRSFWPDSPPALTDTQNEKIRDTITGLLTDSEDEVLLRTGLTGRIISDEAPQVSNAGAIQPSPQ